MCWGPEPLRRTLDAPWNRGYGSALRPPTPTDGWAPDSLVKSLNDAEPWTYWRFHGQS